MAQGLPITDIVNVTVTLTPPAPQGEDVDTCLIVGTSDVIDVTQRIRVYSSFEAVATDFGSSTDEYKSANLWFSQRPQPTTLSIGRWADVATNGMLISGPISAANQLIGAWTPVTSGGFLATLDGGYYAISGLDFSAQTNLNGVASVIQTVLDAEVSGSTCVWDATYTVFRFTVGGTAGTSSTFGFLAAPTATGTAAFSGNPTASDTLTLNGTAITFVSGTPTGNQVQIGATLADTLTSLLAFLHASADAQLVKFNSSVVSSTLYLKAATAGAGGDALTLAKSSTAITLSGATLAGGSATDVSGMLAGLSTSSGAYVADGVAAESAVAAVTTLDVNFGTSWFGLVVPAAVDADHLAIAAYVEAASTPHFYGVTTQEDGVITSGDTSNIAYQLKTLGYNNTAVQYSSSSAYAVVSMLARILTTNWSGNNTTITLKFKQEPGVAAETLTETQAQAAQAVNANVFVNYANNTAIIQQGVCSSGQYIDSIIGLAWLALTLQTNLYAALYQSATKIPMTDAGNHQLATVIANTLDVAVTNGLIGPGTWNQGGFGALNQGTYLAKGYYVFQPLVSSMSASDRSARRSVPFQIAVNLAGAIHSVSASILVNS